MKKKPIYTHPELAEYIENLFNRHGTSKWNRLFYIIREETVKTITELVANNKLFYLGANIEPPPPFVISNKRKLANLNKSKRREGG